MDENIAHAADVGPVDVWIAALNVVGNSARRFADDFDITQDSIDGFLVVREGGEVQTGGVAHRPLSGPRHVAGAATPVSRRQRWPPAGCARGTPPGWPAAALDRP